MNCQLVCYSILWYTIGILLSHVHWECDTHMYVVTQLHTLTHTYTEPYIYLVHFIIIIDIANQYLKKYIILGHYDTSIDHSIFIFLKEQLRIFRKTGCVHKRCIMGALQCHHPCIVIAVHFHCLTLPVLWQNCTQPRRELTLSTVCSDLWEQAPCWKELWWIHQIEPMFFIPSTLPFNLL